MVHASQVAIQPSKLVPVAVLQSAHVPCPIVEPPVLQFNHE